MNHTLRTNIHMTISFEKRNASQEKLIMFHVHCSVYSKKKKYIK